MQGYLIDPAWMAVFVAVVALMPEAVRLARWLRKRHKTPFTPKTQSGKDRENYALLLHKYKSYLGLLEDMIILKAQHNRGPDEWTPELEQRFVETLDGVYNSLEKFGDREDDMGVFQLLDILEERMVGTAKERRERAELEERQADIENHALFIKRSSRVDREKVGAD